MGWTPSLAESTRHVLPGAGVEAFALACGATMGAETRAAAEESCIAYAAATRTGATGD